MAESHLQFAESAKRCAAIPQVKLHLANALLAQPQTPQVWLEAARTLEELGELDECRSLLEMGYECTHNDQLNLKLIRVLERLGDHTALKRVAGSYRADSPDRSCKVLVDAAHFEVRAGNHENARAFLACLLRFLPQQGPVLCEVCRVESILGNLHSALAIAEKGVQACGRYGPLWFTLLRLAEKAYGANKMKNYVELALRNVCPELQWKIHIEVAAACGREGDADEMRRHVGLSALCCPDHLRWKIWLMAARAEVNCERPENGRKLLRQAKADAPSRVQVAVCIERARLEEFLYNPQEAGRALEEADVCEGSDWKVFLERIFMKARQGCASEALNIAAVAIDLNPGTGRLWSAYISLEHGSTGGVKAAMVTFRRAVRDVPKSGEVWCEGARIFLNPFGQCFNLERAAKCLKFAVQLTPQFGDSFLELMRLRLLLELQAQLLTDPLVIAALDEKRQLPTNVNQDRRWRSVAVLAAQRLCERSQISLRSGTFLTNCAIGFGSGFGGTNSPRKFSPLLPGRLEISCGYAEPNYGFLWFWCRQNARHTPSDILHRMREETILDLTEEGALWAYAIAITCGILGTQHMLADLSSKIIEENDPSATDLTSKSIEEEDWDYLSSKRVEENDRELSVRDFTLGSIILSRCFSHAGCCSLEPDARQRLIFGSDLHSA